MREIRNECFMIGRDGNWGSALSLLEDVSSDTGGFCATGALAALTFHADFVLPLLLVSCKLSAVLSELLEILKQVKNLPLTLLWCKAGLCGWIPLGLGVQGLNSSNLL